jgi:hypothetical protein
LRDVRTVRKAAISNSAALTAKVIMIAAEIRRGERYRFAVDTEGA